MKSFFKALGVTTVAIIICAVLHEVGIVSDFLSGWLCSMVWAYSYAYFRGYGIVISENKKETKC